MQSQVSTQFTIGTEQEEDSRRLGAIDTHITLSAQLYETIEQQAQIHGCSISAEITSILTTSLGLPQDELIDEFNAWEAASDEDWLKIEALAASEAKI